MYSTMLLDHLSVLFLLRLSYNNTLPGPNSGNNNNFSGGNTGTSKSIFQKETRLFVFVPTILLILMDLNLQWKS